MFKVYCCPEFDLAPFYEILPEGLEPWEATTMVMNRWPDEWKGIALECEISDVPQVVWNAIPESLKK